MKRNILPILLLLLITVEALSQSILDLGENEMINSTDTLRIETKYMPDSIKGIANNHKKNKEKPDNPTANRILNINENYAVGTIEGVADVSSSGAANYQIPIPVPEGISGLKPVVTVSYNSQSGNGVLGYGWSLSASSVISRCGKAFYYDNASEASLLSNSDNLMLDGQRLMLLSGENMVDGAKYRKEFDPYTEIAYKTVNSFPCFVVRTQDGSTMEYGSTANSYIESSNGQSALFWLLSKSTDKNGNSITYDYEEVANSGEACLTSIQYAGNRSVRFNYEVRNDKQTSYIAGTSVNTTKILKGISTYIGEIKINEYRFDHEFDGYYSKLKQITEYGQNGEQFNPTVIDYGYSGTQQDEYLATLSVNREGNKPLFADFDGDGRTDFLSYPEKESYTTSDVATLYLAKDIYGVGFYKKCTVNLDEYFSHFILADMNGDSRMDAVMVMRNVPNGTDRYSYYLYDGEKLTYDAYITHGFNTDGEIGIPGDFNGDGKFEILIRENQKVFDSNGNEIASGGIDDWGSEYLNIFPNNRYLGDFNGNGKTDILVMNGSGCWVYELNGTSFTRINSFATSELNNWNFPSFGDFNGDGKTDILNYEILSDGSFVDVNILFSTGSSFVRQDIADSEIGSKVFVGDFNRDGKSDIFHMQIVDNAIRIKVGTYNGTNFTTSHYSTLLTPEDYDIPYEYEDYLYQVADFDGDGRSDFCCARYVDNYIVHTFTDDQTLLAKSISNGLGGYASFEYASITDEGYCGNTGGDVSFPVTGSTSPIYVAVTKNISGGNYSENMSYYYKDPRIHRQGKGFLGFAEIEARNFSKNLKTITKYGYNEYYYPFVTEQKTLTSSGSEISTSGYENAYVYQSPKRVTPYIKKKTETNHLTGTVITTECTEVSNLGTPYKIVTNYGSDATETVTTSYFNSGTDELWMFCLPTSIEKIIIRAGQSWTDKQSFEYDEKYRPNKKVTYTMDGTRQVSEETFGYDGFGNVTTVSTKAYNSPEILTTSYEYSSDGVYQTKITDPMGLITTKSYDSSGRLTSSVDPRNKTTTYAYDGMGRQTMVTYPDGVFSSKEHHWSNEVPNGVYYTSDFTLGKPTVETFYDAIGRELRVSQLRFDNTETHTDKEYDFSGRLSRISMPFKGASASNWNTSSYDEYNRLTQIAYASGKIDSYSYSGTSITETKDGIVKTKTFNAKGELITVSDPAGTITYSLRPDGQPASIKAPGNIETGFSYDDYGRQTGIYDPSAGLKMFGYDDSGNIISETDAKGAVKTMQYDRYGRITKRILPEFETTFEYDSYGSLTSETSTNGTSKTYAYDEFGRLSQDQETADDKWLRRNYSYGNGYLLSKSYHSSADADLVTENYSYELGHLTEIKLNGQTSIWNLDSVNNLGQPTRVITGPVNRYYAYDMSGFPVLRTASSEGNGLFQSLSYSFNNATGNLIYRKQNNYNIQEDFSYDNLNRLAGYPNAGMAYDEKGNITGKSDIGGTLYYGIQGKPYAVSGANSTFGAIPLRNQHIDYTSFERPAMIDENNYQAYFSYNNAGERVKMLLKINEIDTLTRYYLNGCYEIDQTSAEVKERLYLGGDAYSAPAVYVKENGNWNVYYICRDYLGSITHVTNSSGMMIQEMSYDVWGRLANPSTLAVYGPGAEPELFLGRGYTGHEYLPMFGLINMNARLYDPALGRFLSPDPYVQASDFSQGFNRYSYCLNNPLRYTDQSGEWFGIDDLLIAGAGFIFGYVSHGITTGNWGWKAVAAGGMGAGMAWLGYNTAGMATGVITNTTWNQIGGMAINAVANQIMPPMNIPIGDFGLSISPGFGLGASGLTGGINLSGYYSDGNFGIGAGVGAGSNYWGWNASATYKGYGGGYGQTSYGNAVGTDLQSNAQRVASGTLFWKGGSFTLQNDMKKWGGDGDRWRTNALELTIGKFTVGSYIYTNDGETESRKIAGLAEIGATDPTCLSPIWGKNRGKFSTWTYGETFSAPVWVGYRQGNQINRIGYSFPGAQDFQQNGIHKYVGRQHFYTGYNNFQSGFYSYSGYNNPLTLWGY